MHEMPIMPDQHNVYDGVALKLESNKKAQDKYRDYFQQKNRKVLNHILSTMYKHQTSLQNQPKVKVIKKGVRKLDSTGPEISPIDNTQNRGSVVLHSVVFTSHMRSKSQPQLNFQRPSIEISNMQEQTIETPMLISQSPNRSLSKFEQIEKDNTDQKFKLDIFKSQKKNDKRKVGIVSSSQIKFNLKSKKQPKKYIGENKMKQIRLFDEVEPSHLQNIDHVQRMKLSGNPMYAWEDQFQKEPLISREGATFTCINEFGEGLLVGGLGVNMVSEYHM